MVTSVLKPSSHLQYCTQLWNARGELPLIVKCTDRKCTHPHVIYKFYRVIKSITFSRLNVSFRTQNNLSSFFPFNCPGEKHQLLHLPPWSLLSYSFSRERLIVLSFKHPGTKPYPKLKKILQEIRGKSEASADNHVNFTMLGWAQEFPHHPSDARPNATDTQDYVKCSCSLDASGGSMFYMRHGN